MYSLMQDESVSLEIFGDFRRECSVISEENVR